MCDQGILWLTGLKWPGFISSTSPLSAFINEGPRIQHRLDHGRQGALCPSRHPVQTVIDKRLHGTAGA